MLSQRLFFLYRHLLKASQAEGIAPMKRRLINAALLREYDFAIESSFDFLTSVKVHSKKLISAFVVIKMLFGHTQANWQRPSDAALGKDVRGQRLLEDAKSFGNGQVVVAGTAQKREKSTR